MIVKTSKVRWNGGQPPVDQTVTTGALSVRDAPRSIHHLTRRYQNTTPAVTGVAAVSNTVVLRLSGYADDRQYLTVKAGITSTLQTVLSKEPDVSNPPVKPSNPSVQPVEPSVTPPVQVKTTLYVTSTPGSAAIVLDGQETGKLTPQRLPSRLAAMLSS